MLSLVPGTHLFGEQVRLLQVSAFAESTRSTLLTHGNKYHIYCETYKLVPFPVTLPQLEDYLAYLSVTLTSAEAVGGYVSGFKTLHKVAGFHTGVFEHPSIKLMLKGLKRVMQHVVQQARPVTPELLKRLAQQVDKNSEEQKVIFLALLLGFYLFLQRSNLAPVSWRSLDKNKLLLKQDVRVGTSLTLVHVKWTKTLQFQQRKLLLPLVETDDKDICPVSWLNSVVGKQGQPSDLLLAVQQRGSGDPVPLLARDIQRWFRHWLGLVGENPAQFSLHSLRRGGATWAFQRGLPAPMIRTLGDWASDAYLRYLDTDLDLRVTAMQDFTHDL